MTIYLPRRSGPPPTTTHPTRDDPHPHTQLDQNAPVELQDRLHERAAALPGVFLGASLISVPDARAFHLDEALAVGPPGAFQRRTEFAHIHPGYDGSLHLTLPPDVYDAVLAAGWGEPHPISGTMMLFGPRDDAELELVWQVLQASYGYATGAHRVATSA